MAEAERPRWAVGCPRVDWQVRASNVAVLAFHRAIGFAVDTVASLGKRVPN